MDRFRQKDFASAVEQQRRTEVLAARRTEEISKGRTAWKVCTGRKESSADGDQPRTREDDEQRTPGEAENAQPRAGHRALSSPSAQPHNLTDGGHAVILPLNRSAIIRINHDACAPTIAGLSPLGLTPYLEAGSPGGLQRRLPPAISLRPCAARTSSPHLGRAANKTSVVERGRAASASKFIGSTAADVTYHGPGAVVIR
jgi:hypothetical protein